MVGQADWALARDAGIAALIAFVAALAALALMMRLLRSVSFTPYVIYRIALGVLLFWASPTANPLTKSAATCVNPPHAAQQARPRKSPATAPVPPHRAFMAIANTWRRFRRWVLRLSALVLVLLLAWVLLYRFVAPPGGLFMWQEYRRLGEISRQWVPLHQIAPINGAVGLVAAEDANFCRHWGFDMSAIRQVIEQGCRRAEHRPSASRRSTNGLSMAWPRLDTQST